MFLSGFEFRDNQHWEDSTPRMGYTELHISVHLDVNKTGILCVMYTEALSPNHCNCGRAIRITYSACVFVALVIQHAMCMRPVVICGLSDSRRKSPIMGSFPNMERYIISCQGVLRSVLKKVNH